MLFCLEMSLAIRWLETADNMCRREWATAERTRFGPDGSAFFSGGFLALTAALEENIRPTNRKLVMSLRYVE
jgi:hypothetical protein